MIPPRTSREASPAKGSALAALFALSLWTSGCDGGSVGPSSALLVTLDTTRADAVGCYGNSAGASPAIDRMAREGTVYLSAYTVTPLTLPSHASMLTGLTPPRHSVRENGLWPLPGAARTLAELAAEEGIQTAAFVAARVLDGAFGLAQGFDTYDGPPPPGRQATSHYAERPAAEVVDRALAWLGERERSRPFFVWVHVFEPHSPYAPPADVRERFPDAPYLGEVFTADRELGRLFDALREDGSLDGTFVCIVGDHGEAFGEHGAYSHGPFCYEASLRVPFVVRDPSGHRAGEESSELVSVVDVFPTLADALGLDPGSTGSEHDGRSVYRQRVPEERGLYFESYAGWISLGWSPLAGWRDRDGKYLHSSEPQLFDLTVDPGETRNLAGERPDEVRAYRRAISDVVGRPGLEADGTTIDDGLLTELRGLGYAALGRSTAELPHPLAPSDRPSPQSMAASQAESLRGLQVFNSGDVSAAREIFERVLAGNPDNWFVLDLHAYCLMREGRHAEAIAPLRRILADGPERASTVFNLAVCLNVSGRRDEALETLLRVVELDPEHAEALAGVVELLEEEGRAEDALPYRERLAELSTRRAEEAGR